VWKKLKNVFGGKPPDDPPQELAWVPADESPWGVPVLDLQPVTRGLLATSKDPQMAANAVSYGGEDGSIFIAQRPPSKAVVQAELRYRIDRVLLEGVLFQPRAMEDKWAVYYRDGRLLFIRSWLRKVSVSAAVHVDDGAAVVGPITGSFVDEPAALTPRLLDYVMRTHVLGDVVPVPLEREPEDLRAIGLAMFSTWGRNARYATHHAVPDSSPVQPVRTDSLLHIALARGDKGIAASFLDAGVPFDVLARNGLGLPHWALAGKLLPWLLDRGCPVDVRSDEGATALMNAVQDRSLHHVRLLVERGADVNAADARGFTSLHRAAEMGELAIAKLLVERGARTDVVAMGKTPRDLAELRGEKPLIALLSR
jgi:hypothetical protein